MDNNVLVPKPHRILNMLKHTKTECTFRVACDTEPGYGQFFMLSLPKVGEAPISASGKGRGYVEFTIRNVGLLTQAIFELEPGNSIFLRGPYGNQFPVKQFENKDLLIICGGTGMAPVLTMINISMTIRRCASRSTSSRGSKTQTRCCFEMRLKSSEPDST